jgi:large subunit ribosomal protein L6
MPVPIPPGGTVSWNPPAISVKGPKGELFKTFPSGVIIEISDGKVVVRRQDDGRENRMRHGLVRSLIMGMVHGVTQGYEERLALKSQAVTGT